HEYLESVRLDRWPEFTYRVGDVRLRREMLLIHGTSRLVLRWSIQGLSKLPPLTLRIKPLLAYRHFHALTTANPHLNAHTTELPQGFSITPYDGLPTLFVQVRGPHTFLPAPDWFHHVEYMQERERGF
ncbi:glycogen debranching protein, partial [Muribaculaceae bacterium Isolate-002 (NCI)]